MILFHGTADPLVPFRGGPSKIFRVPFPDVPRVHWLATNNGCHAVTVKLPDSGKAAGVRYAGETNTAEVVFYTLSGGGHTWPGGGTMPAFLVGLTPSDISATRLMWDFFQQHPMVR
jgi:polyhydroxybutyrate depolymerase